jgi:hypothetical protein
MKITLQENRRMQKLAGLLKEAVEQDLADKFKQMGLNPGGKVYIVEGYPGDMGFEVKGMCVSFNEAVSHIYEQFTLDDEDDVDRMERYVEKFSGMDDEEIEAALEEQGLKGKIQFKVMVSDQGEGELGVSYLGNCSGDLPSFETSDGEDLEEAVKTPYYNAGYQAGPNGTGKLDTTTSEGKDIATKMEQLHKMLSDKNLVEFAKGYVWSVGSSQYQYDGLHTVARALLNVKERTKK